MILEVILIFITLVFLFGGFQSRTRRYRKQLVDLYVVGKVKNLASKDGIDLEEEYSDFRKFYKKSRAENKSLDDTIELEMQDEIVDESSYLPEEPEKE